MNPTGCPSREQGCDPGFAAGRRSRPKHRCGSPICPSCCSTASAVRGALVMRTTVRPSPAPMQQPLRGAGVEVHAVVNDAPDVAQDQPVPFRQRVEKANSRPASDSASSIGATSSGLSSSRKAKGATIDLDHRDLHALDEEAQLLKSLELLEIAERRRDVALQGFAGDRRRRRCAGAPARLRPSSARFGEMRISHFE